MAQQQAPDDIFALYCRFDLDVSQYHVFERGAVDLGEASQAATTAQVAEPTPVAVHSGAKERPRDAVSIERRTDRQTCATSMSERGRRALNLRANR